MRQSLGAEASEIELIPGGRACLIEKEDRFSNRKSYPGTEEAIWSISVLPVPGGIQAEVGHPPLQPPGLLKESLHRHGVGRLLGPNEAAGLAPGATAHSFIHRTYIHQGLLCARLGTAGTSSGQNRTRETSLNLLYPYLEQRWCSWSWAGDREWRPWLPMLHVLGLRPPR